MSRRVSHEFYFEDADGVERTIVVEIDVTAGTKGRLYGPPEDCYPASAPTIEPVSFSLLYPDGKQVEREVTEDEAALLLELDKRALSDRIHEVGYEADDEDEGPDYDREYDAARDREVEDDYYENERAEEPREPDDGCSDATGCDAERDRQREEES